MTTLREAAQQALEVLQAIVRYQEPKYYVEQEIALRKARASIIALRAALAQEQAEPTVPSDCADSHQPVQEPVAWMESPHGAIRANPNYKFTFPSQLLDWQIPLYTAPPKRQPLTDEEIDAFVVTTKNERPIWRRFARAVEAEVLKRMGLETTNDRQRTT